MYAAVHLPAPKVGQGIEVRCAPLWQRVRQRRTFGHSWIARSPLLLGQRNRSRQGGRYLLRPCLRQAARVAFRRILSLSATVADHYSCSEAAYLWSSRQWSSRSTVNMFAAGISAVLDDYSGLLCFATDIGLMRVAVFVYIS